MAERRSNGDVFITSRGDTRDSGFLWIAAAYAVHQDRVLLVFHNTLKRWVPPGGHLEANETLAQTAHREFEEETGLHGEIVSAAPVIHPPDNNASPDPAPFYVDIEREGFRKPAIVSFYFLQMTAPDELSLDRFERREVDDIGLFAKEDLDAISTFDQVRSLSRYVLDHHPAPT